MTGLFGGIGGLELGLLQAGHQATAFCEIDPEASTILKARFPGAVLTRDIRRTEEVASAISPLSDLLTAGFPCTDLSQAGRVEGFRGDRSSLIRDALRLLDERPFAHVLLENVPNWRSLHRGAYLDEVVTALEKRGYRWAYRTIDALAFGTPQRRLRIFLYATLEGDPRDVLFQGDVTPTTPEHPLSERAHGFYWTEGTRGLGWGEDCVPTLKGGSSVGVASPPAILLPEITGAGGLTSMGEFRLITLDIRDAERLQGFPANWSLEAVTLEGDKFRERRRWLLVGNAVNVRAAAWLGERLASPRSWVGEHGWRLAPGEPWPMAAFGDASARFAAPLGSWPVAVPRESLTEFLSHSSAPLSARATSGFLGRLLASNLRVKPGFVEALQEHLERLARWPSAPSPAARRTSGSSSTSSIRKSDRNVGTSAPLSQAVDPRRSALMARVRQRDSSPEMIVRRALHRSGFRYRLHAKHLPGSPDIVFPSRRLAVFVHGCFWHRHGGCKAATNPKTRQEFWHAKFERNVERDVEAITLLEQMGWRVHVVWECEAKSGAGAEKLLQALRRMDCSLASGSTRRPR